MTDVNASQISKNQQSMSGEWGSDWFLYFRVKEDLIGGKEIHTWNVK